MYFMFNNFFPIIVPLKG